MRDTTAAGLEATIREYFDGCNEADADEDYARASSPTACTIFRPARRRARSSVRRRSPRVGLRAVENLGSIWTIDRMLVDAARLEAVIEWTHFKPKQGLHLRGDEWYLFSERGLIREIRAYYACPPATAERRTHELGDFDYAGRGYPLTPPASQALTPVKITAAESFLLKIPIGSGIADSMQFVTHLEIRRAHRHDRRGHHRHGLHGHGGTWRQRDPESARHTLVDDLIGQGPARRPRDLATALLRQIPLDRARGRDDDGARRPSTSRCGTSMPRPPELPLWQLLGGARSADIPDLQHACRLAELLDRSARRTKR